MHSNSTHVASTALHLLDEKLWQGVAAQNISKIAPNSAHLEGHHIIDTFMNFSNPNKQILYSIHNEADPQPAKIDSLCTGVLDAEQTEKKDHLSSLNDSRGYQGMQRQATNKSSNRVETVNSQMKKGKGSESAFSELTLDENKHQIFDPDEERLRSYIFEKERQAKETKLLVQERQKMAEQRQIKNKKLIRDLKKYTFDYEGKFFALNNSNPGKERIMKMINRNGEMKLVTKDFKKPDQFTIENDKLKDKEKGQKGKYGDKSAPMFSEKGQQSLLDNFEEEGKISEGVKFTATKGDQSITKEKARPKLSGMKKYRRVEYKNMTKDKMFVKHKYPGSLATISAPEEVIPLNLNKQERKRQNTKVRSEKSLELSNKNIDESNILPRLKNRSLKSSKIVSNYSLDEKESGRTQKRQKVSIDDEELYSVNFSHGH